MNRALMIWSRLALVCAILCMASMGVLARSGGGTDPTNTAPPLVFDFTAPYNGVTPTWTGDSTITNSIPGYYSFATLRLNLKAKSINLPDNPVLLVTAYTTNTVTGQPMLPVFAPNMVVLNRTAQLKSKTTMMNYTFDTVVRRLDQVVVRRPTGPSSRPATREMRASWHGGASVQCYRLTAIR